jgi:hypothetical protein
MPLEAEQPFLNDTILKSNYKMEKYFFYLIIITPFFFNSCSNDDDEKDTEYPAIVMEFPDPCDTLYIGEKIEIKAKFSDNAELGAYSLDFHHNFDHHTHGTHVEECILDPIKSAVNPFKLIKDYTIPTGQKQFDANIEITIPDGVDEGDYHFMLRLVDAEGWQSFVGIGVKVLEK